MCRKRQILAAQHEGATEGDFSLMLKTLISEGRLVYQTVVTQDNGPAETVTILKSGPIAAIVTTARTVDPELKTRVLVSDTDESGAQTVAIVKRILSAPEAKPDLRPWLDLQEWLGVDAPYAVIVPFREAIYKAFEQWRPGFLMGAALRMRRDISSFLSGVEASTVLHKAQRETAKNGASTTISTRAKPSIRESPPHMAGRTLRLSPRSRQSSRYKARTVFPSR